MKFDKDKPPMHLVPSEAIEAAAHVFAFGAEKYGAWNWRDDADVTEWSRTYSSIQRHLNAFWSGEDTDPESGLSHIDHALTQLMILKVHMLEYTEPDMDDRYRK